jgi:subtilisin family serine protease
VEFYEALPGLLFAQTDDEGAQAIGRLPGVRVVRRSNSASRRIVWAMNEHLMISDVHRRTLEPNGVANGTVERRDSGEPKLPRLGRCRDGIEWGWDDDRVLPTRLALVAALNVSLQANRAPYDPDDPVSLAATEASRVLPIVVAAGNRRPPSDSDRRIYGWAAAPNVISVGATLEDGRAIAPYSLVGDVASGLQGPTVVADGDDESGVEFGTSFAAPKVSSQLALIAAALMLLRSTGLGCIPEATLEGVPLVARCFIDIDALPGSEGHGELVHDFSKRRRMLPCLPTDGANTAAVKALIEMTGGADSVFLSLPRPEMLTALLLATARPVPDAGPDEAGAGWVSTPTTTAFLLSLTARGLCSLSGVSAARISAQAADAPLLDGELFPVFAMGAIESMIGWAYDITKFDGDDQTPAIFVERPIRLETTHPMAPPV